MPQRPAPTGLLDWLLTCRQASEAERYFPFGLARIVPAKPPARQLLLLGQAMPYSKLLVPELPLCQVHPPFVLARMVPRRPRA